MRAMLRAALLAAAGGFLAQTGCSGSEETCVPSAEVCDGQDNDCNGEVDEGCACVNAATQPCYTGAANTRGVGTCHDGQQTCVDGQWGDCLGEVLPAHEQCDGHGEDEDCDGIVDDGFAPNENPNCSSGTPLVTISGDTDMTAVVEIEDFGERWYGVRLTEDSLALHYLSGAFMLTNPAGVDFDLYVYCYSCASGVLAGSSTVHSSGGHSDLVSVRMNDFPVLIDDFTVVLEVRFHGAEVCAPWTLSLYGNVIVPEDTC